MNSTFLGSKFARTVGVTSILGALLVWVGVSTAFSATPLFTNVNLRLPWGVLGSVAWGDYDNDGRLDFLLTGYIDPEKAISRIYHNEGDGTFTWNTNAQLPGSSGGVAWGDYDNDGRLDVLLPGDGTPALYHNNGDGSFTDIHAGLVGVRYSSVARGESGFGL